MEKIFINSARYLQQKTKLKKICLAGGVALNCVGNYKILEQTDFQDIFVQPATGDAGGAVGSALYLSNTIFKEPRHQLEHSYLGPEYSEYEILKSLKSRGLNNFEKLDDESLTKKVAQAIYENKVVAWFQGRMEFGPRALGNRSILANPCSPKMKDILNLKVKKREAFRPYAPMVLREKSSEYFTLDVDSPYMLLAPNVHPHQREKLPAITHNDGTARVQTIGKSENPLIRSLILEFEKLSGVPVLLNTSFNLNGEPVVCTPSNAINTFMNTQIDYLAIGPYLVQK